MIDLPINFTPMPEKEVQVLMAWLAQPGYLVLRKVLEAKRVEAAFKAVEALVGKGEPQAKNMETRDWRAEAEFYGNCLRLLEAVGQGYYDDDKSDGFEYTEMRSKV